MNKLFFLIFTALLITGCIFSDCFAKDENEVLIPENKGNLRYSITVTEFENKAGWHGHWDIGSGFVEIMTDALQQSGWFIVLGDKEMRSEAMKEQDFAASGRTAQGNKAPKIGRMTPAQLLVKGSITHVQSNTSGGSGGLSFRGIRIGGGKDSAEVNMTIYLVDSETGQVKASKSVIGKSDKRNVRFGFHRSGVGGDLAGHQNDNLGKACEDAVWQATSFLIDQLEDITWSGKIMLSKPDKIIINRGEREGLKVGMAFDVGKIEELVDEDTGEVLDVDIAKIGTIEVTEVKEKLSYCKAIKGEASQFEKGMSIMPVENKDK